MAQFQSSHQAEAAAAAYKDIHVHRKGAQDMIIVSAALDTIVFVLKHICYQESSSTVTHVDVALTLHQARYINVRA